MNYAALLLLMVTALIRPSEYVSSIFAIQLYLLTVIIASVASLPQIMQLLTRREVAASPVTACVLGVFAAVPLSLLWQRDLTSARVGVDVFSRIVLVYLIIVGALVTPRQFTFFLRWIILCVAVATAICLMDYHGTYDFPLLETRLPEGTEDGGASDSPDRLQFTGIFNNPNGLARILVFGIMASIYFLTSPGALFTAPFWLGLIAMFGHALMLTKSRGGLLGLAAGVAILFVGRFGVKRSIPLGLIAVPIILFAFGGGRQNDFNTEEGTGQHRIQLWNSGLELLKTTPIFGIGYDRYGENMGFVAHNSFVHAYVELGLFGGTFFVGCYYFALSRLFALRHNRDQIGDPNLRRAYPYLIAILGAEAVGMLSISLTYGLSTYLVLALSAGYIRMVEREPGVPQVRFDKAAAKRLATVGVLTLIGIYIFVKWKVR